MSKIIITNTEEEKKKKIFEIRLQNPFAKVKFFSLREFINNYPYIENPKALDYIMEHKEVSLEIAKIYLENLKYNVEDLDNEKCNFLKEIKQELIEKKLLQKNEELEAFLSKKEIELYNVEETKYLQKLISKFSPNYITREKKNYTPKVYRLKDIESEITFVGEQIATLLKKGISIDHIFLSNVPTDYKIPLKRIFRMLHLPLALNATTTLNQTTMGVVFIDHMEDLNLAIEKIKELVETEEDESLYNQILSIVNNHILKSKKQEFILYDLQHTKEKKKKITNCIHEIDFKTHEFKEEDYVFLMSFTNDVIPKIKKDEEYLSDQTKEQLGIDTSNDLNKLESQTLINAIKAIPHATITLKMRNASKDCVPSELIELMNLEIKEGTLSYNISHEYNKFILGTLLDKYVKYGTTSDTLLTLNQLYKIPYRTYQNNFTPIPKEKIWQKKNNKLQISYTHLDTYNKCAFSYYIKYILNLDSYEETFQMKIGNIFHKIIEEQDYEDFDYDTCFESTIKSYELEKKELILLNNLKEEFRFTIDTLDKHKKFSSLKNNLREHSIEIPYPNEIETNLIGRIDNVQFERIDNTLYYTILDYKTGSTNLEEEKMSIGFHLQLPTYLYLLKQEEYFKKGKLGGFYLQPLIVKNIERKENEDFSITKEKALKRKGFSSSEKEILKYVDSSYPDSHCIQSLKVKSDGEFYQYSKVLTQKDEETLEQVVKDNISSGIKNITNGEFPINPKIINNEENIACEFCPFKDLCYHEAKDNVYLETNKKFLKKEENHGMDERTGNSNLYEGN